MNKKLSVLLFFVIPIQHLYSQNINLQDISKCLVKIQVNNTSELLIDSTGIIEEDYSLGTGFYISSDGLFLTAAHVLKDRNKDEDGNISCYENTPNSNFVPIIIFEDYENDIALLQNVSYTNHDSSCEHYIDIMKFNKDLNKKKNEVFSFGFPNDFHGYNRITSFSFGNVLATDINLQGYKKLPERKNVSLANCVVLSGCSGGLITDSLFRPVGLILGSILENNTRKTYYKSISDIKELIEEYEIF